MVDEIFNEYNARKMGIEYKGQVCVMIHCGSRGLGHQVATGRPRAVLISPTRCRNRATFYLQSTGKEKAFFSIKELWELCVFFSGTVFSTIFTRIYP